MKKTKIISAFFAVLLLVMSVVPFGASAITIDTEDGALRPGNLQFFTDEYSFAWLNKLVIRDDATAIKEARIVPKAVYPYSKTYADFLTEVDDYSKLKEFDEKTAVSAYNDMLEVFYYAVTAMGMTEDYDEMFDYLWNYGIRMPDEMTASYKMMVSCVYAAIKYDAVYALYEQKTSIPAGITLEGAAVNIIAAIMEVHIPSGIATIEGFAIHVMKDYIEGINEISLSQNPSEEEIFHWMKAVTASKSGYDVPMIPYAETTEVQRDYVDYAYYATILNGAYEVKLNPFSLQSADESDDEIAVQLLILKTMLTEKEAEFDEGMSGQTLFDLACQNGCFNLEEEFYSDIFNYDVYVKKDCVKLWFTPFSLADQLGGDNKNLSVKFCNNTISAEHTAYAKLDTRLKNETVEMTVTYDDGMINEVVTYIFNIIKTEEESTAEENDLLGKIEEAVGAVVPEDNEKAQGIIDSVFEAITTLAPPDFREEPESVVGGTKKEYSELFETYKDEKESTTDSGLAYLEELFGETYADSELTTSYKEEATGTQSAISKVAETVRENPEIVFAPTSIVTVGGLLGYFLTKRKREEYTDEDVNEE